MKKDQLKDFSFHYSCKTVCVCECNDSLSCSHFNQKTRRSKNSNSLLKLTAVV